MHSFAVPLTIMALSGEVLADTLNLQDIVGGFPQGPIMELPLQPDAEVFADLVRACVDGDAPYFVSNFKKSDRLQTTLRFGDLTPTEAGCVSTLVEESDFATFDGFYSPYGGSFLSNGEVLFDGPYPEDFEARNAANDAHVGQPQYRIGGGSGTHGREGSESQIDMFEIYVYGNGFTSWDSYIQNYIPPTIKAYGLNRLIEREKPETVYVVPSVMEDRGVSYEVGEGELSNGARYVITGVECPNRFAFVRKQYFPGDGDEELFPYGAGMSLSRPGSVAGSDLSRVQIDWIYYQAGENDAEPFQFCRNTERLQRRVPSDKRLQRL